MSVPHVPAPALDEHHHSSTAPHSHTQSGASAPTTFAAATALALAGSRPPTSQANYEDEDEEEDDDYGGGIPITPTGMGDYQIADTHMADEDTLELQVIADQLETFEYMATPSFDPFEPIPSMPSYHIPSIQMPISHLHSGFTSSSDPSLEPPPTSQEVHLSIRDNHPFLPITSFFHSIAPERPTVPGLDLVQLPATITSDDLRGEQFDCHGIDWSVRKTKRSQVRARRVECESARAPVHLREIRKVCSVFGSS